MFNVLAKYSYWPAVIQCCKVPLGSWKVSSVSVGVCSSCFIYDEFTYFVTFTFLSTPSFQKKTESRLASIVKHLNELQVNRSLLLLHSNNPNYTSMAPYTFSHIKQSPLMVGLSHCPFLTDIHTLNSSRIPAVWHPITPRQRSSLI